MRDFAFAAIFLFVFSVLCLPTIQELPRACACELQTSEEMLDNTRNLGVRATLSLALAYVCWRRSAWC